MRRFGDTPPHTHNNNNTQQTGKHEYPQLPKFLNRHSIFKEEHSDYIVWTPLSGGWVRILLTSTVNPESRIIAIPPRQLFFVLLSPGQWDITDPPPSTPEIKKRGKRNKNQGKEKGLTDQ